jgi:hypothetical protein
MCYCSLAGYKRVWKNYLEPRNVEQKHTDNKNPDATKINPAFTEF